MKLSKIQRKTLVLFALIVPMVLLFFYVALRSGPLAPVEVVVIPVSSRAIRPALFGVGTVEARYNYQIGPTTAGRIKQLSVQVGDRVDAGQLLGIMDPVDLEDHLQAQQAAIKRAEASIQDAIARQHYARAQAKRYEELLPLKASSEEVVAAKQQELQTANAVLTSAREECSRLRAEYAALHAQKNNLRLVAPVAGLVTQRAAEPGSTVVAGQTVIEMIDPATVWINTRFDQGASNGLRTGLTARIELRSRKGKLMGGKVIRIEPKADSITEEVLAKVAFATPPDKLPPIGELAEVTIEQPASQVSLVLLNTAIHHINNRIGVWKVHKSFVEFVPVRIGASDLDGYVQVLDGLKAGDQVALYSAKALTVKSRIKKVERLVVSTQ